MSDDPSLKDQAKNLLDTVVDTIKEGKFLADQDMMLKRLEICKGCEFFWKDTSLNMDRCKKCGCNLQLKARVHASKCPIDKW